MRVKEEALLNMYHALLQHVPTFTGFCPCGCRVVFSSLPQPVQCPVEQPPPPPLPPRAVRGRGRGNKMRGKGRGRGGRSGRGGRGRCVCVAWSAWSVLLVCAGRVFVCLFSPATSSVLPDVPFCLASCHCHTSTTHQPTTHHLHNHLIMHHASGGASPRRMRTVMTVTAGEGREAAQGAVGEAEAVAAAAAPALLLLQPPQQPLLLLRVHPYPPRLWWSRSLPGACLSVLRSGSRRRWVCWAAVVPCCYLGRDRHGRGLT